MSKEALSILNIISHPLRYAILKELGVHRDLADLSSLLKADSKISQLVLRYHLSKLERCKLIYSLLKRKNKQVSRVYYLTPLGKLVLYRVSNLISEIEKFKL